MVSISWHSIQDFVKNINRKIGIIDIFALFVMILVLFALFLYLTNERAQNIKPFFYKASSDDSGSVSEGFITSIFGSVSGKTYTFSYCSGAKRIKEVNKIYFKSEAEAKESGRTLSKLCK